MRSFIFALFFGADDIAKYMFQLLSLRKDAVTRHNKNKELEQELTAGQQELFVLKSDYYNTKESLESAYRLDLD